MSKQTKRTGEVCPHCGQTIPAEWREIKLYKGIYRCLYDVFKWAQEKGIHEFAIRDIRGIIGTVAYTKFSDLILFGGIVYRPRTPERKPRKGWYGLNMERLALFFIGQYEIPTVIFKNNTTGELEKEDYRRFYDIPELRDFLDEDGQYKTNK